MISVANEPSPSEERRLAKVERTFDRWAPDYEKNEWYKAQGREVLKHLRPGRTGLVLDVGCGTGWLLRRIVSEHPEANGIGIDLSPRMIEEARNLAAREGAGRLEFVTGNFERGEAVERLEERIAGKVDTLVCVSSFHYFRDPRAALAKMFLWLRPGGGLLLLDREMEGSPLTRLWNGIHRFLLRDHVRFYPSSRLLRWMSAAGFSDPRVVATIRKHFRGGKLYTSLVLISAGKGTDSVPGPAADAERKEEGS